MSDIQLIELTYFGVALADNTERSVWVCGNDCDTVLADYFNDTLVLALIADSLVVQILEFNHMTFLLPGIFFTTPPLNVI